MKKILIMLMFIIVLLTGCDPASYYFTKTLYLDKIESIELVEYSNNNYEIVDTSKTDLKFDYEKVKKLETLDTNKINEFLDDFEKIVFHIENESVNEPIGYCLIWHLKNGNFIVFCCTLVAGDRGYSMVSEFDSTCRFIKHYADFASGPHYDDILSKYFPSYILE